MVFLRPAVEPVKDFLQPGMVRGGKTGQAQFIVAGVVAKNPGAVADEPGGTLPEGAVNLTGLTEPAAAHTAAQNFHAGAVLHGPHHRHHKILGRRKGIQILHNGLGHPFRDTGTVGTDGFHPSVRQISHIIKGRNINARDLGQSDKKLFLIPAGLFPLLHRGADLLQHLFAFAQLHHVKKVRHRLGVAHAGASRDNQRPTPVPVAGAQRNTGKIQHRQHVGIAQLILQREADNVEFRKRVLALQAVKGNVQPFHLFLHVGPGHESALTPPVFMAVEQLIKNFLTQKGHTNLIGVREAECHAHIHMVFILIDTARFTAGIAPRLLYQAQRLL